MKNRHLFSRALPAVGILIAAAVAVSFLLPHGSAQANVITVTTETDELNTGAGCSLREAIQAANTNLPVDACPSGSGDDVIELPAGTYKIMLAGTGEDNNAVGDFDILGDLSIVGDGIGNTIIDGQDMDRIFDIHIGPDVHISGLTMGDGRVSADVGGAIFNHGTLHLSQAEIVSNAALSGGAIESESANLTIEDSIIADNEATLLSGGGIRIHTGGSATIERTVIEGNHADTGGGGVWVVDASVDIIETTIKGNSAAGQGGGVYMTLAAEVNIVSTTISGNSSEATGGGLYVEGTATVAVTDSTISGNSALQGGGIAHWGSGLVELTNTTISGNEVEQTGGGLSVEINGGSAVLLNVTITDNVADSDDNTSGFGGGVSVGTGSLAVKNTIIAGNVTLNGADPDCAATVTSEAYNLIGVNSLNCTIVGDITGNIVGVDPMLGPLADNGGLTATHALLAASPALDAAIICPPPDADQRGQPRPQGTACDMGAFEAIVPTPSPTSSPTPTPTPTGQTPTPTQTLAPGETPEPTPTPTSIPVDQLVQGDNDCDGDTDSVDALTGLRHIASFSTNQQPGCPALGGALPAAAPAGDPPGLFGDVDCDDDVDAVDALGILRKVVAFSVSQNEPCADIGEPL